MEAQIIKNLNNPAELEKLYRSNKNSFKNAFYEIYEAYPTEHAIQFWKARLEDNEISSGFYTINSKKQFWLAFQLIIIAGLIANISNIHGVDQTLFFSKNISFIIMPWVATYFLWNQNVAKKNKLIITIVFIAAALYVNILPNIISSSTINLAYIHLPLFLWCILGFAYIGEDYSNNLKRINFLKFNGDLLVISVILFLAGMLFSVLTMGLFELIGMSIGKFYFEHIAIWGLGGIPIIGTYLINTNPQIINKVTPIIAKIFTPLVFVNLSIYLVSLIIKGKYPFQDRNLLVIYNALLIGVLALIFFSVVEIEKNKKSYYNAILLFCLAALTIIINGITVSAIFYRLFEYGITPNRIAVLGGNILIFIHLVIVATQLFYAIKNNTTLSKVQISIARYLPVYAIWVGLVAFLIPIIFNFK